MGYMEKIELIDSIYFNENTFYLNDNIIISKQEIRKKTIKNIYYKINEIQI